MSGLDNVQLDLVNDSATAEKFIQWLSERRPYHAVSVDIETGERPGGQRTDSLSPWLGQIRLVQVGDAQHGWAIPWDSWKGVFYEFTEKWDGQIVFHNAAFEAKWFGVQSSWKLPWHAVDDTYLMSQVVNPASKFHGLKPLSAQMVDGKAVNMQAALDEGMASNGWSWGTVPINFEPYWLYGALDTVLTMRIWEQFREKCGPGKMYSIPYELEMNARRICTTMELNGARVDLEYSQKMHDKLLAEADAIKDWMAREYNGTSIGSPIQLARLFEKLNANITERTPKGGPSINKDQLDLFVRDGSPEIQHIASKIIEQRKAEKLATTYFSNFLSKNSNGILHPEIRLMGARTGRMSITEPALQTLPSNDPLVRTAFVPRNEGWGIIASDLDQVEFRLTAAYSQDPSLIQLFHEADATQGDVFTSIMRQIYADDSLQKSDPRRKLVKGVVYGKLYGAGVDKMALTAGVQTQAMREVVEAFDSNYPGVKLLQKSIERAGTDRLNTEGIGYVNTRTGRRLPCDSDRVYSLTNYLIQATAAEVFKQNLVKIDAQGLTDYMIVPVHDEIVLEAPPEDAEEVKQTVRNAMTTAEGWAVPLTADVEGPFQSWGHKYLKKS